MKNNYLALASKKILTVVLCLMLVLSVSSFGTLAAGQTPDMTVTDDIVVTGVIDNDEFSSFKLIDIDYDDATNTLSYAWTTDAQTAVDTMDAADQITVENYMALTAAQRKTWLGKFISKYFAVVPTPTATQENAVAAAGSVTFADHDAGGYLIRPTLTTSVYEPMLAVVTPNTAAGVWTDPAAEAIAAKKAELNIDKKAAKVNEAATDGPIGADRQDVMTFTVVVDVPVYDETTVDKTFTFADTGANMNYVADSLVVEGLNAAGETAGTFNTAALAGITTNATIPAGGAALTMSLPFNYDDLAAAGVTFTQLKITYKAKLANGYTVGDAGNDNDAQITYSNYPYVTGSFSEKDDTVKVLTYKFDILKYDGDSTTATTFTDVLADGNATPLAGATFNLFRLVKTGEVFAEGTEVGQKQTINGNEYVLVQQDLVTDANGRIATIGVDATNNQYILVETKAPNGYNAITAPIAVGGIEGTMTKADDTYQGVAIANNKGLILPVTGGMGTLIFSIAGIVLMAGAVVVLLISKKRKSKEAE